MVKISHARINGVKSEIIVSVLDYIETKEVKHKTFALENLSIFAKYYNIPLRKKAQLNAPLMNVLKAFILNNQGYKETIIKLYNSLI